MRAARLPSASYSKSAASARAPCLIQYGVPVILPCPSLPNSFLLSRLSVLVLQAKAGRGRRGVGGKGRRTQEEKAKRIGRIEPGDWQNKGKGDGHRNPGALTYFAIGFGPILPNSFLLSRCAPAHRAPGGSRPPAPSHREPPPEAGCSPLPCECDGGGDPPRSSSRSRAPWVA